jgi:hypothetical protein
VISEAGTGGCEVSGILMRAGGRGFEVHLVGLISYGSEMNDDFGLDSDIEWRAITCCRPLEQNRTCEIDLIDYSMAVDMPW